MCSELESWRAAAGGEGGAGGGVPELTEGGRFGKKSMGEETP